MQGELNMNLKIELHELKKNRDINGLKKEMHVMKTELQDHKKDKKQLIKENLEGIKERDDLKKGKEKLDIAISKLTTVAEIHKGKLKKIKEICDEDSVIELSG
ncbi:Glycerophosphodiester phosphodiesterase GDE1 [Hordeum vulgare]|nr:Glycerophosphodiester phosphodiesterase GDE1 [Hordeum vulgare]